ncbi:M16 family metallopeptidase [Sphingopyxis fribergensis]
MRLLALALSLAALFAAPNAIAAEGKATIEGLDPAVRTGRLPNGLTFMIRRHSLPKGKVFVRLVVRGGSADLAYNEIGYAHLLEHLAFNALDPAAGSTREQLANLGAIDFGSDANAATAARYTTYFAEIDSVRLAGGIAVARRWARPGFTDAKARGEAQAVAQEIGEGTTASNRLDPSWQSLIEDTPAVRATPAMHLASMAMLDMTRVRRLCDRWFRAGNQALIIVGDVDPVTAERIVRAEFGDLPAGRSEFAKATPFRMPTVKSGVFADPETNEGEIAFHFPFPRRVENHLSAIRANIVDILAASMLSERLDKSKRRYGVPFVGGSAAAGRVTNSVDSFRVWIAPRGNRFEQSLDTLAEAIAAVRRDGFSADELANTKRPLMEEDQKPATNADIAGQLEAWFTEGAVAPDIARLRAWRAKMLDEINLAEVNFAVQARLDPRSRLVVVTGRTGAAGLPSERQLMNWLKAVDAAHVPKWKKPEPAMGLPQFLSSPRLAPAPDRRATVVDGISEWRFANGAVLLVHADPSAELVRFYVRARPRRADLALRQATDAVENAGIAGLDKFALAAFLKSAGVSFSIGVSNREGEMRLGLRGSGPPVQTELLFRLFFEYATAPRKDPAAFDDWLMAEGDRVAAVPIPQRDFGDYVWSRLRGQALPHPQQPVRDAARLYSIFQSAARNGDGLTAVISGPINEADVERLARQYIGSLPALGEPEAPRPSALPLVSSSERDTVRAGTQTSASVILVYSGEVRGATGLAELHRALEKILVRRINQRLRDEEGGIYIAYVGAAFMARTHRSELAIQFNCAPADVDRLVIAAEDEVSTLASRLPSEEEMALVASTGRGTKELSLDIPALVDAYTAGELRKSSAPAAVTSEDIQAFARGYLTEERFRQFVLLPAATQR